MERLKESMPVMDSSETIVIIITVILNLYAITAQYLEILLLMGVETAHFFGGILEVVITDIQRDVFK